MQRGTVVAALACCCSLATVGCGGTGANSVSKPTATETANAGAAPAPAPGSVRLDQGVRVFDPSRTKQGPSRPSLSVSPGDVVQVETLITRAPKSGLTLEISLDKGPGTSLRARAEPRNGKRLGGATIRSATGRKIRLALGRYTCVIGATPFCDSERSAETSRAYTLITTNPPPNRPIVLSADVVSAGS